MGSGVSVSHGRWGIKFRLRHSGVVVSWKGTAVLFDPRVRQSSTPECRLRHPGLVVSWKGAAALFDPRVHLSSSAGSVCVVLMLSSAERELSLCSTPEFKIQDYLLDSRLLRPFLVPHSNTEQHKNPPNPPTPFIYLFIFVHTTTDYSKYESYRLLAIY